MSSLYKYLFKFLVHFEIRLLFFYSVQISFIFWTLTFDQMHDFQMFSFHQQVSLLLSLFFIYYEEDFYFEVRSLVLLLILLLVLYPLNNCWDQCHEIFPLHFSGSFIVLDLMVRSLIHFDWDFVLVIRVQFHTSTCKHSIFITPFGPNILFSHVLCWQPCWMNMGDFISKLSILLYEYVHLFL